MLAVLIGVIILTLAVPSVSGLFAEQRLQKSFDRFDDLVREAQQRSMTERRAYVLGWQKEAIVLRPEVLKGDEDEDLEVARLDCEDGEAFAATFPAALEKKPDPVWVFWPSGTCEPALIAYEGKAGKWTATYDPLTVRGSFEVKITGP
jgi:hypothetical protein